MSSYSFSHQFYQRWTCAPELIRQAIIQELTDITTLLQPDTSFIDFVFDTHDLDAHLDELYDNHHAEQAIAKAIADKQATEEAKTLRLKEQADVKRAVEAKEALDAKKAEDKRKQQEELEKQKADKNKLVVAKNSRDETATNSAGVDSSTKKDNLDNSKKSDDNGSIKALTENARAHTSIRLSLSDTELGADHTSLIRDLETSIDDYVSEQMMQISENLKSWMRAEVTQRLGQTNQTDTVQVDTAQVDEPDKSPNDVDIDKEK